MQNVRFLLCGAAAQRWPWPPHSCGSYITNNDTPHSVGLLWTSDQLVAVTSTRKHTTLRTDKHPCPSGIRTHILSRRAAAGLCLRPRGHWDRRQFIYCSVLLNVSFFCSLSFGLLFWVPLILSIPSRINHTVIFWTLCIVQKLKNCNNDIYLKIYSIQNNNRNNNKKK